MKKFAVCFLVLLILNGANAGLFKAILWGVGAAAAVTVAGPVGLAAVGYTSSGIAAGSMAAGMMSSAAIANGGGVLAGSTVAVLQAAGAAGIGSTVPAVVGAAVAGARAACDDWGIIEPIGIASC